MPFMKNGKRDYQREKEWDHAHGRVAERSKRNQARAEVEKKLGHKLPTNQHVDHKQALSKGGGNSLSNLKVTSAAKNTSFARTKTGAMASETSKRERRRKK